MRDRNNKTVETDQNQQPLLQLFDVKKHFGGIRAVDGVSLEVDKGQITGLIGPNGAGKTTLIQVISGFLSPDSGRILLDGHSIQGRRPHQVNTLGLTKTFQTPREFKRLTVLQNLMVAAKDQPGARLLPNFVNWLGVQKAEQRVLEKAWAVLDFFELTDLANEYADNLSGGQKKLMEMARALMNDPKVLLMDEPTAGVNPTLSEKIMGLIFKLRRRGITFLVVEHDMYVVDTLCDHVIVMAGGQILLRGTMADVQANPKVLEAYLGTSA